MVDKAKATIKEDACIKFYDETEPLYIETDVSGVELGAALLQTRDNTSCHRDEAPDNSILRPIAFSNKSFTGAEKRYSNMEREALSILYGPEKFHHYCFVREVSIITDYKTLIVIFKNDVATLSQRFQQILLRIHQYRMRIISKPGSNIFMADWLSTQNHSKNKDKEITGIQISINAIQSTTNIPECIKMHELQEATSQDQHLHHLMEYFLQGWPESKIQPPQDIRTYWLFRDNMAVIDGVVVKGRHIVIPEAL